LKRRDLLIWGLKAWAASAAAPLLAALPAPEVRLKAPAIDPEKARCRGAWMQGWQHYELTVDPAGGTLTKIGHWDRELTPQEHAECLRAIAAPPWLSRDGNLSPCPDR
jgi:hypothetical protein